MTRPPAKRQRRLVHSDDDEPSGKARYAPALVSPGSKTTLPQRTSVNATSHPKKSKAKATPHDSPNTSHRKGSTQVSTNGRGGVKSLQTFFGRVTEEQRWARDESSPQDFSADGEAGDAIEDDSLDEALAEFAGRLEDENKVLDRRKVTRTISSSEKAHASMRALSSSQRFAKKPQPTERQRSPIFESDSTQVWADRFAPISLDELVVHKRKVADVQKWLASVLQGRDRRVCEPSNRLLVLKGPAGAGKTTTLSLLSEVMDFDISDWRSPTVTDMGGNSFSSQFDDFLNRGGGFGALDVYSDTVRAKKANGIKQGSDRRRVLLIEEFPTIITLSSSALASFRNVLLQYLAAAAPPRSALHQQPNKHCTHYPPVIIIVSESLLTSANASTDSFTAYKLLGPDLYHHPQASILEFNPVAPTLVFKALDLILKKEARSSKRRRGPGPAVLKRLSELGDVRSAANGLEFLCVRGDADSDWGGRTAAKLRVANQNSSTLTKMELQSLELITQREATLGLFHAVGKVVWNKREALGAGTTEQCSELRLQDHLPSFHRSQKSQVDVSELLNEVGTDIQTFIAALHENYVLSTAGSDFEKSVSDCMDSLSESDLLCPGSGQVSASSRSRFSSGGASFQGSGIDVLRQNEISFHIAVRGLSFALPIPVTRAAHPSGKKGDSFKMFYPTSLRLWKPREEIQDLIAMEVARLQSPDHASSVVSLHTVRPEGVESWKSRTNSFRPTVEIDARPDDHTQSRVWALRDEVLLDRLPYMAKFQFLDERLLKGAKKITQFRGVALDISGAPEEDDMEPTRELSAVVAAEDVTDGVPDRPQPRRYNQISQQSSRGGRDTLDPLQEKIEVSEKLYISDDDIVDDDR